MQKYERALVAVATIYVLVAVVMGVYFFLESRKGCSSDGYKRVDGAVVYQNGAPVKCVRLAL